MTLRTPKQSPRRQLLLGFTALLAVITAALVGASQFTGGTARAEQELYLHQTNSVHPGAAAEGSCPTPPAGQESWYGWHLVAPSNENFTSLTLNFATAGTVSATTFPGPFISHPDASHAYIWTATADTLVSGSATIAGTFEQGFFNLSHTCAPGVVSPEPAQVTVTIDKYINGLPAIAGSFDLTSTWTAANLSGGLEASGTFPLNSGNGYHAVTDLMDAGANYRVVENLDGTCDPGDAYRVLGYGTGTTAPAAAIDGPDPAAVLTDLQANHYIAVFNESCDVTPVVGQITIVKQGLLAGATASFTHDITVDGSFTATISDTTEVFTAVAAGPYSVTEASLNGYTLTSATCELDAAHAAAVDADLEGQTLVIVLAAGQSITCTFINAPSQVIQYDVTVSKYVDGVAAAEGSFSLTSTWTAANLNSGDQASGDFTLGSANLWMAATSPMDAGADYSVVENGIDATCTGEDEYRLLGYGVGATAIAAAAATPAPAASIDNLQSDMYIVVFNASCDAGSGSLSIVKAWVGGAAVTTTFDTSANLGDPDNTFDVSDGTPVVFGPLDNGFEFVVTEQAQAGWNLTSITCSGQTTSFFDTDFPTGVLAVTLMNGEDLVCTFTNTANAAPETGSLSIIKAWVGGTAVSTTFTTSANLGDPDNTFSVATSTSVVFDGLANGGPYVVTETALAGWTLTGIDCTGETTSTFTGLTPTGALSVTLAAGEDLVCTFTNTANAAPETGSLSIIKVWVGGAAVSTTFTTSDSLNDSDDMFVATNGTSMLFNNLANAGVYTVTETPVTGWTLTDITCTGATTSTVSEALANAVSVTIAANEDVTCTFTNTFVVIPITNVIVPVVDNTIVSPSTPQLPSANNPVTNGPSAVADSPAPVTNAPIINNPAPAQQPVTSESPVSNVAGERSPLPPSAGNTIANSTEGRMVFLFTIAAILGLVAVSGFAVARR